MNALAPYNCSHCRIDCITIAIRHQLYPDGFQKRVSKISNHDTSARDILPQSNCTSKRHFPVPGAICGLGLLPQRLQNALSTKIILHLLLKRHFFHSCTTHSFTTTKSWSAFSACSLQSSSSRSSPSLTFLNLPSARSTGGNKPRLLALFSN
jgi:hypothetical protein